ncbi:MAG: ABC transporter permease, partial [Giesbergeria sp.]
MNIQSQAQREGNAFAGAPERSFQHAWIVWRYWMLREFKTRYAGSVLGLAWAFLQPLASLAIFYVLFGLILAVRVPGLSSTNGYLLH